MLLECVNQLLVRHAAILLVHFFHVVVNVVDLRDDVQRSHELVHVAHERRDLYLFLPQLLCC